MIFELSIFATFIFSYDSIYLQSQAYLSFFLNLLLCHSEETIIKSNSAKNWKILIGFKWDIHCFLVIYFNGQSVSPLHRHCYHMLIIVPHFILIEQCVLFICILRVITSCHNYVSFHFRYFPNIKSVMLLLY